MLRQKKDKRQQERKHKNNTKKKEYHLTVMRMSEGTVLEWSVGTGD